jgi:hypothetical protein
LWKHQSQTSTQNITSADSTLSDQQYVNRFKEWIRDTMKVLKPAIYSLTDPEGTVTRKIDVWDDSSQLLITDYYSFVYQKQDSFYRTRDDIRVNRGLKSPATKSICFNVMQQASNSKTSIFIGRQTPTISLAFFNSL